jgi:Ca2+-binding EF-hand superfamily protein
MARAQALFDVLDANHDGVLDANEFAQLRTLDGRRAQPPMPPMEPVTVPNSENSDLV